MKTLSLVFLFLFLQWKQSAAVVSLGETVPYAQIWWDGQSPYSGYNISLELEAESRLEVSVHFISISLSAGHSFNITGLQKDNQTSYSHTFANGTTTTFRSLGQVLNVNLRRSEDWEGSTSAVNLVISLYQPKIPENSHCPKTFKECPLSCARKRCVPPLLCSITSICNHENEDCIENVETSCRIQWGNGDEKGDDDFNWWEVQYLMTILLAGLFFILSPMSIIIFLFTEGKWRHHQSLMCILKLRLLQPRTRLRLTMICTTIQRTPLQPLNTPRLLQLRV